MHSGKRCNKNCLGSAANAGRGWEGRTSRIPPWGLPAEWALPKKEPPPLVPGFFPPFHSCKSSAVCQALLFITKAFSLPTF